MENITDIYSTLHIDPVNKHSAHGQKLNMKKKKMNLLVPVNSDLLLYGNKDLSLDCNLHIQELFSNYIIKSKKFLN